MSTLRSLHCASCTTVFKLKQAHLVEAAAGIMGDSSCAACVLRNKIKRNAETRMVKEPPSGGITFQVDTRLYTVFLDEASASTPYRIVPYHARHDDCSAILDIFRQNNATETRIPALRPRDPSTYTNSVDGLDQRKDREQLRLSDASWEVHEVQLQYVNSDIPGLQDELEREERPPMLRTHPPILSLSPYDCIDWSESAEDIVTLADGNTLPALARTISFQSPYSYALITS